MNNSFDISQEMMFDNETSSFVPKGDFYLPEQLPWWQQVLWFGLFGGMVTIAASGNIIVIWIVMADKRMRTVATNIFIVNLSIADTMVSTLNVIFNFVYMLSGHWPFGCPYCKISQFVSVLSIAASVFTLMAISCDRYIAIMFPLKPRMRIHTTVGVVVCIWLASATLAAPNFVVFTTVVIPLQGGKEWTICYGEWPDGDQTESYYEYIYSIVILVVTYVLPMISMGFTYTRVGITLWGNRGVGEQTRNHVEARIAKRKVVKMMIVVVVIFGVCWLPFHLYFILVTQIPEITSYKYVKEVYLAIYWMAMSNSMYNPMIYCWLNRRFRCGFKRALRFCPFSSFQNIPSPETRRRTVNTTIFSSAGCADLHYSCTRDRSLYKNSMLMTSSHNRGVFNSMDPHLRDSSTSRRNPPCHWIVNKDCSRSGSKIIPNCVNLADDDKKSNLATSAL